MGHLGPGNRRLLVYPRVDDSLRAGVSGGAGAGQIAPSIDISQMQGEVPSWLKWIADNKDKVLAVLG